MADEAVTAQWIRRRLALHTLCGGKLEARQLGVLCVTLGERCKFLLIRIQVFELAQENNPGENE